MQMGAAVSKICSPREWLSALLDHNNFLQLEICREWHRSGKWGSLQAALPQHMVVLVERGYFIAKVAGIRFQVGDGDVLWIPQGASKEFIGLKEVRILRQHNLRFKFHVKGRPVSFGLKPQLRSQGLDLLPLFRLLQDWSQRPQAFPELRLRALLGSLMTGFFDLPLHGAGAVPTLNPLQRQRISELISNQAARGLDPSDLAARTDLTLDYFTRLFKNTYGVPPRTYLKQERMRMAAERLVETQLSVAEVAHSFEMPNVSFFCRQFRSVMGCSPKVYRQRAWHRI